MHFFVENCVLVCLLKVLNNGELLEFDTPSTLLSDSNSYFVALVEQTGSAEAEYLRTLASQMQSKQETTVVDDEFISAANENDPLLV